MSRCMFQSFPAVNLCTGRRGRKLLKNLKTAKEIKAIFLLIDITAEVMEIFGKIKTHLQIQRKYAILFLCVIL